MILGTAAYMSPGAGARARPSTSAPTSGRSACVLYEMLTGKRAFEDEDVSMTLSKVLQREPDFDALPPSVPARVRQALRVCLRKDPKQRAGDIRDVRLALEGAFETTPGSMNPVSRFGGASSCPPRRSLSVPRSPVVRSGSPRAPHHRA